VLGMLGADVHSKGIRTLARHFRDAGVEVVYLGEHNTPEGFAASVASEDADIVGLSFSTASYLHYIEQFMRAMDAAGVADVPVMVGGLIHRDDEPTLRELGVAGIFGPGSSLEAILEFVFASGQELSKRIPTTTNSGRHRVH
jgi:methylmalonyl-CoA mutase C-terminal domain/subunit